MGRADDFYPPPMRENPKGFYENVRFRRQNDKILRDNGGYRVKSWSPDIPGNIEVSAPRRDSMMELIMDYQAEFEHWGWKDPRTSLTMKAWLEVLVSMGLKAKVCIIRCARPFADVAQSMMARGNKEREPGQFEAVSRAYHKRLSTDADSLSFSNRLLTVEFAKLLRETEKTVARVEEFIGVKLPDLSFIEPQLERTIDGTESKPVQAGHQV
jgi:hypothetical protein